MAQLVEALSFKSEGRGFDSQCCHWNFSLKLSFRPHYGLGFESASNRYEYRNISWDKGGRCVELTKSLSCAVVCNLRTSASWKTQGLSRSLMGLLCFYFYTDR